MATSEAQKRATRKYDQKHRAAARRRSAHSSARSFIRKSATLDDLVELQQLIDQRTAELKANEDGLDK